MNKRRLGGLLLIAGTTGGFLMWGTGCARGGHGDDAAKFAADSETDQIETVQPAGDGTESLVARGAAGLDQYLKNGRGSTQGDGAGNSHQRSAQTANAESPAAQNADAQTPVGEQPAPAAPVAGASPRGAVTVKTDAQPRTEGGENQRRSAADLRDAAAKEAAGLQPPSGAVLSGWWGGVDGGNGGGASTGEKGAVVESTANSAVAPAAAFWKSAETAGTEGTGAFQISGLALCSRVEGFGKFTKVETVRATGKPVPLLIYTQLDGFAYRTRDGSITGTDDGRTEWVVEIGQSVVVYRLGADGTGKGDVQVKVEPEQTARDVALFKRRDHFLVQRIELPTPLVAGKYAVKVTVRDKATGVVDERVTEVVVR